ncbi:MAG: hypothetical protein K9H48_21475 [Melioribacteraceae bacterium]|nr:hypothetical protein [Melioribacteraceae bacterium]MCF8396467.1 hypothetical protein [Melioribacteraceae bacterium]
MKTIFTIVVLSVIFASILFAMDDRIENSKSNNKTYPDKITATGDIIFGDIAYLEGKGSYLSLALLDETHFVLAYDIASDGARGYAVIGVVSGTSVSYGSSYQFYNSETRYVNVAALDASHFVVIYSRGSGYSETSRVGTVNNGTEISFGPEYDLPNTNISAASISTLDATHFVVAYKDNNSPYNGTAVIGTVSGTAITYGTPSVFNPQQTEETSTTALDASHFVVAYKDWGGGSLGTAVAGSVSGTTITFGSEYVFKASPTDYHSTSKIDDTHFLLCYSDYDGGNSWGTAEVGTVSGSTITFGSTYIFNSAITYATFIQSLDATRFVISFDDGGDAGHGNALCGTISNVNELAFYSESTFSSYSDISPVLSLGNTSGDAKIVIVVEAQDHTTTINSVVGTIQGVALPVELTSFQAEIIDNTKIVLNWETATEVNNYGFSVERTSVRSEERTETDPASSQTDYAGINWEKIGFVEGHGNSNSPKEYSFTDILSLNLKLAEPEPKRNNH